MRLDVRPRGDPLPLSPTSPPPPPPRGRRVSLTVRRVLSVMAPEDVVAQAAYRPFREKRAALANGLDEGDMPRAEPEGWDADCRSVQRLE